MKICVIFNPTARGTKASRFRAQLDQISRDSRLKLTDRPGAARQMAAEAVEEGFETVVAAGGDGTVNEVLNGIASVPGALERVSLAVMPLGTINVFARELGLPTPFKKVWEIILSGKNLPIDLPEVAWQSEGQPVRRFFAQLAGAGLDARAVELVNWEFKKRSGYLAYAFAVWQAWRSAPAAIHFDDESATTVAGPAEMILIGNGRFYAGSFAFFPQAQLADGLLDVCVFPRVTWLRAAPIVWSVVTDRMRHEPRIRHFQCRRFTIHSEGKVPLQLDGEAVGHLPAEFSLRPKALRVIVP